MAVAISLLSSFEIAMRDLRLESILGVENDVAASTGSFARSISARAMLQLSDKVGFIYWSKAKSEPGAVATGCELRNQGWRSG
jgi:hypothetical protein